MKLAVPQQRRAGEVTPRPPRRMAVSAAPQPAASPASGALHPVVQTKLKIGAPNDEYEQEADRVADQVLAAPANSAVRGAPPLIQRYTGPATGQADTAPTSVDEVLAGAGTPLDPALQQDMEQRFGHDFGQVRVHADSRAAESANAIDALAYTAGRHLVFGTGRYAPGTSEGNGLLAHELTHTVQQGQVPSAIQRSLKFEIQTRNSVWAVKNTGTPDPRLLPRKYASTTVGFREGLGEERGDKPAYLSVGREGGPAKRKGERVFVEAEGPLVTEEATSADAALAAQFIREYRFKTQVTEAEIIDKRVRPGQLSLVGETDNAKVPAMAGMFNLNTFELKYSNKDGTPLDVHLNKKGIFKTGHVKLMKIGRSKRPGLDEAKDAQVIEIWKVTDDPNGPVDFLDKRAKVELISVVDHAKDPEMKGQFNPNTWEKNYFLSSKFTGDVLSAGATPEDVHMDVDGRLRKDRVKFMVREKLPEAKEQTAIELQSEREGVLEFETPKWFRRRTDVIDRIQEAVDITHLIDAQVGTTKQITDPATLAKMDARRKNTDPDIDFLGNVVEWPSELSTAHLKNLHRGNRRLLVQIPDTAWMGKIQASEGIALSEYEILLKEHELAENKDIVIPTAKTIFDTTFQAAKIENASLNEDLFANLKGFLQLIVTYIVRGQVNREFSKTTFRLMARTHFGSMHNELLSAEEKALFKTMVGDPRNASDNPILTELEAPLAARMGLGSFTLTRTSKFFFDNGPAIYKWLVEITKGKDLLSGSRAGVSDALGAKSVEKRPGDKEFKQALFEVRGTVSHGGNFVPRTDWLAFAMKIFEEAKRRAADTPDDPTTPKVNESSKTGLID